MIPKAMIAATLFFAVSAFADDGPIVLAQAPYPDGYSKPARKPSALPLVNWIGPPTPFCAYFDIDPLGYVSNVHVILSTGDANTDGVVANWLMTQRYVPAAINGKPLKVRNLFGWSSGKMPPENRNYCNWSMYRPES